MFRKILKIPNDQHTDMRNVPIGMSKKVYNEMFKEMDIIASQEEPSQLECALNVCNHLFYTYKQII